MIERRKFQRGRTYLGGRIAYDKPCTTDDCLVRNLSEDGAKLVFSGATMIPNEFELTLRESGEMRRVRIVWRRDVEAGPRRSRRCPARLRGESAPSKPTGMR
jgi:hypothetical protein